MPTHSADEWLRVRVSQQPLLWKRLNSPATREWIDAIHSASSFPNHKTVSPDNWWHTSLFFFTSQHANMHRICKILLSFKGFAKLVIFQSKMLRVNGNNYNTQHWPYDCAVDQILWQFTAVLLWPSHYSSTKVLNIIFKYKMNPSKQIFFYYHRSRK